MELADGRATDTITANNNVNNSINNNSNNNMSDQDMLSSRADSPILKTEYDIDVIRLIGQHLNSLGLKQTVNLLLQESGIQKLDHPLPEQFKDYIMAGEWDKANALVDELADLIASTPQHNANYLPENSSDATTAQHSLSTSEDDPLSGPLLNERRRIANAIRLAIAEQKFLEYLEDGQHLKACRCLRLEISPYRDVERVQHLTTLLMCRSPEVFKSKANWPGKGVKSRQLVVEKIQRYIPPLLSLPPRRLNTLLQQAIQLQRNRCILHIPREDNIDTEPAVASHRNAAGRASIESNTSSTGSNNMIMNDSEDFITPTINNNSNNNLNNVTTATQLSNGHNTAAHAATTNSSVTPTTTSSSTSSVSLSDASASSNSRTRYIDLKQDHICAADRFPLHSRQQIDTHKSEVWFCKFSEDGMKLATGGLGGKVKIWLLDPVERKLLEKCTLDCNSYSVTCLSWSPNGNYLLVCGPEDRPDLWIWNVNKEEVHNMINLSENESATTCSWHRSGEKFAVASIKGNFHTYDLDGNRLGTREGVRVQCLSFLNKDPKCILAADTLSRIKAYSVKDMSLETYEEDVLEERHPIMSFVIDKNDHFIAVNLMEQGVHLWNYKLKTLVRMFSGVIQRNMTIFSSFSGLEPQFLASGSEDGKVYIYSVDKDHPVAVLCGHSRCVNCVTWNPRYPEMLVSASDDRTIRLWAPIEKTQPGGPTYTLSNGDQNC